MIANDGDTVMTDSTVAMHSRRIFYRVFHLHVYTFDIKIAVLQFLYQINRDLRRIKKCNVLLHLQNT